MAERTSKYMGIDTSTGRPSFTVVSGKKEKKPKVDPTKDPTPTVEECPPPGLKPEDLWLDDPTQRIPSPDKEDQSMKEE